LQETAYLTWQMLEQGVPSGGKPAGGVRQLAAKTGQGEGE
jgi:hypothetical protein